MIDFWIFPLSTIWGAYQFTHFVEFFSFNKIGENHKEKELVRKVTVVVALDLGCGNTKNSEYESE